MKKVIVQEHDPAWQAIFTHEAQVLTEVLQDKIMLLEHIGSTAVEGVVAVPIVDILLGMKNIAEIAHFTKQLNKIGFVNRGEFGVKGRRFLQKIINGKPICHVHGFSIDNLKIWQYLYFKQYLIAHPKQAKLFSEEKQKLAQQFAQNLKKYFKGKIKLINEMRPAVDAWECDRTLTSERLLFRSFVMDDASEMHKLSGIKEITETTSDMPFPLEEYMVRGWIEGHREDCVVGKQAVFALESKETGNMIGAIELIIDREELQAEIGYWIGKPFWRQGYGMEAAKRMLQFGFEDLCMQKIFATIFTWNDPSKKMLAKLGFTYEKVFTKYVEKWDKEVEIEQYQLLRKEYFANR